MNRNQPTPTGRIAALVAAGAAVLASVGCVALRPYADVAAALPAGRLIDVAGQRVHIERAGRGEPVVFVHGFACSTYSWRHVLPAVAASHDAIALDLNGFGWTERRTDPAAYTRSGQVRLVLGVMDALGVERAHLVGHSYGGAVATALAATHPDRVRTLVLVDAAAPTYPDERRSRLASTFGGAFLRLALREATVARGLRKSVADPAVMSDAVVREYLARLQVEGMRAAYRGLTVPAPREPRVDVTRIAPPTLLVWGAEDRLIPVAGARKVAERMGAEIVVYEGVGHMPMEERPAALVATLREWLERHRG